jgi:SAM-dependent methyltransferase
MSNEHDQALAKAFDGQAPRFERAPVQSDPAALERLVQFAGFPTGSLVLDAGCGPGLVCEALLRAEYRVIGVDLSKKLSQVGLERIEFLEESFVLDFDEWFDRGTPVDSKENVRAMLLAGPAIRGFRSTLQSDGSIRIACFRGMVRGGKPTENAPCAIPDQTVKPNLTCMATASHGSDHPVAGFLVSILGKSGAGLPPISGAVIRKSSPFHGWAASL